MNTAQARAHAAKRVNEMVASGIQRDEAANIVITELKMFHGFTVYKDNTTQEVKACEERNGSLYIYV